MSLQKFSTKRQAQKPACIMGIVAGIFLMAAGIFAYAGRDTSEERVAAEVVKPVIVTISLGGDVSSDCGTSQSISYSCATSQPAAITRCEITENDFSNYGCSSGNFNGSCNGDNTSCSYSCSAYFGSGTHSAPHLRVQSENSQGSSDDKSDSISVNVVDSFVVNSIAFTDSGSGVVNPRSSSLIITTNLAIGTMSQNPHFNPPSAAAINSCASSGNTITCSLQKKGAIDGKDIFIDPELSNLTVIVDSGSATWSGGSCKTLNGYSQNFTTGCVLRKVKLEAQTDDPLGDITGGLVVGENDLWGNCNPAIGQEYRAIKLRNLNCSLTEVKEMRMGSCVKTPDIAKSILRDDYSDVDILENPLTDARFSTNDMASFGPLGSKLTVKGDNFYPYSSETFVNAQPNPSGWGERTFSEVWMGEVKVAGVGKYTQGGAVDFYGGSRPSCAGELANCGFRAAVAKEVPECAANLEVRAAVKPLLFTIDSSTGFPQWDNGERWQDSSAHSLQYSTGLRPFVVVPSVKTGSGYRGAMFTFKRANELVSNQFNQYLQTRPINQAPTGLPLTLQIESSYLPLSGSLQEQDMTGRSCVYGTDANDALTNNLCGFGDYFATHIGFYNDSDPGASRSLMRVEKDADFFEVGKPWQRKRIFPLAPFFNDGAVSGKIRAYACGGSIGFIESNNGSPNTSAFQVLSEPFGIHTVSPSFGDVDVGYPIVYGTGWKGVSAKLGTEAVTLSDAGGGALIGLLPDTAHEPFTSVSPLEMCRNGFCASFQANIIKQSFNPGGRRLPVIESVTPPTNWHATPLYITKDIPLREQYCVGEEVTITGSGFGTDPQKIKVSLWSDGGFVELSPSTIIQLSDTKVTVNVPNSATGLYSVDCPRGNTDMSVKAALSNLRLPSRVCIAGGRCALTDQQKIFAPPPARSRIVSDSSLSNNYCIDDILTITGSDFGEERLGARIKINGEEVARYISWSKNQIVVTPPSTFSGKRSPNCPRHNPNNGLLTANYIQSLGDVAISCPDIPSGARGCTISQIDPISFNKPVYEYNLNNVPLSYFCEEDVVKFDPSFTAGTAKGKVSFFSDKLGWKESQSIINWSETEIAIKVPQFPSGDFSLACPHGLGSPIKGDGTLSFSASISVFNGPIEVCVAGGCYYVPLSQTSASAPLPFLREKPLNKNYWIGPNPPADSVIIKGRYFEDIRSDEEFIHSGANQTDKRSAGYVEFYSDEFGFVPAYSYQKWTDDEIVATPPRVSLESVYGGPREGVSIAGMPIRVCTREGCSANLAPVIRYKNESDGVRRDKEFWPEALISAPACLPSAIGAAPYDKVLLTVYGKDLHKVEDAYIVLDDGIGSRVDIQVYENPALGFKEQYKNRIIFSVPTGAIAVPEKADAVGNEPQVVTGKLFLISSYYRNKEGDAPRVQETPLVITFSRDCLPSTSCIGAPYIRDTNNGAFGEGNYIGNGDAEALAKYAAIEGCNFGESGKDSFALFGDTELPVSRAKGATWGKKEISLFPPLGAGSGLIGIRVWTGLQAVPVVWGANALQKTIGADTVYTVTDPTYFEIFPTISAVASKVGIEGQIVDIYGSGFCSPAFNAFLGGEQTLCTMPVAEVAFGVWQKISEETPAIVGASARIFDYSGGLIRVEVPKEPFLLKSKGDLFVREEKLALSGQVRITRRTRNDTVQSRPYFQTETLQPHTVLKRGDYNLDRDMELMEFPHYFTKAPAFFDIQPKEAKKRDKIIIDGIGLYGRENSGTKVEPVFANSAPRIEVWDKRSIALPADNNKQGKFSFDTLESYKSSVSDIFPLTFYQFPERQVLINNPVQLGFSNWDGAFFYTIKSPSLVGKRFVAAPQVFPAICLSQKQPSFPNKEKGEYPPALPSGADPIRVKKIDPLHLFDACAYCGGEDIAITGRDPRDSGFAMNFGNSQGRVYFWSDAGWQAQTIQSWTDTSIVARVGAGAGENYAVCPRPSGSNGELSQIRLPVKICRFVAEGLPDECAVFGLYTHLLNTFSSGEINENARAPFEVLKNSAANMELRTYPPQGFGRLNLPAWSFFEGSNVIDKIAVEEGDKNGLRQVALFVNSIYNDVYKTSAMGTTSMSVFSVFADDGDGKNLGGVTVIKKKSGGYAVEWNKDSWSTYGARAYNGVSRQRVCKNAVEPCDDFEWFFPSQEKEGTVLGAYGFTTNESLFLVPDPPRIEGISYVRQSTSGGGYLRIRGRNFFGSEVTIDGKKYTSGAKGIYARVSSSEIRLALSQKSFSSGRHTLRLTNSAYGPSPIPQTTGDIRFLCDKNGCGK